MAKLTPSDLQTLQERGISLQAFEDQLEMLRTGFPFLKIFAPATTECGIKVPSEEMQKHAIDLWEQFLKKGGKVVKLVPASGAASRMFKNLFSFLNGKKDKPDTPFIKEFFENIEKFAFFPRLNFICIQLYGKSIQTLINEKRYKDIIGALLLKEGLNYGILPKALLQFHKTIGTSRTPLEEHLAEAAQYAVGKNGEANIHFTVSEDHIPLVKMKIEEVKLSMGNKYGVNFNIETSVQKPSTDTICVTKDGEPFRKDGQLFFRPGGHGALIENLNDIDADIVFIKNIDNIVPDNQRTISNHFKKIAGGILVGAKAKADEYCHILMKGTPEKEVLDEMLAFLHDVLCITHDSCAEMSPEQKASYIFAKLNRPMRVCGMVKNEGEPGGGPYLVYNPDGTVSPQILESVQLNLDDKKIKSLMEKASHFNPVDLVCALRDFEGNKFFLPDYIDKTTGFLSDKSVDGIEIKALERPGLWNGAMANWNTIFVEVPIETFNPVKTVNDLLRKAHQPE
ncbi:MAG: DUF4301 family protein [Prevotella sp.]|nr:DUF4301 family protein [Bacteroides sp.]MCM1366136.1 DUF4301 family protein [Prevotella sp.]MCM1436799.1 DUF4301 family protein [Prevotella sp.]